MTEPVKEPRMPAPAATREYKVREFKGMQAVFRGDRLVTRTASLEAAVIYADAAELAHADRKPKASVLAPVETQD